MTHSFSQPELFQPWNNACEHWLLNQATDLEQFFPADEELQENRDEEKRIADVALNGFISTVAIFGAIDIGLFESLESSPCQLDSLAQQLNVPTSHLNRLLLILQRLELVTLKSEKWRLQAPARRFFTPTAPTFEPYLWSRLAMTRQFLQNYATEWGDIMRGKRQFDELQWPPRNEQETRDFEHIMTAEAPYIAARLKPVIQEKPIKRLLDVAGGNGTIAALLAHQQSDLQVDVLNWPHVAPLITETAEKFHLTERVRPLPADFVDDYFPTDYDAVLFSRVLFNWPDEVVIKLLSKACHALKSEGRIMICERMKGPAEGVSRTWLTFMATSVNAQVFGRTPLRWIDLLDQAGFYNPRLEGDDSFEGYGVIQAFASPELNEAEQLRPSKKVYQNGDTVQVTVPPSPEGQTQYLGLRMPNRQTFILDQFNTLRPFDGVRLPAWKGGDVAMEQVILPNIPRGKYLLYYLYAPEDVKPMLAFEQWTLNVSMFRVN